MNSILKDIRRASLTIEHVVVVINMKERFEKRKLECAFTSFCVFSRYLKVKRMGSHLAMSDYCNKVIEILKNTKIEIGRIVRC